MTAALRITATGPLATIQDLGRPGWFHAGVGVAGAADRRSLTLANRLLGNDEGTAAIECLLGGVELTVAGTVQLAVTGAPAPITLDGRPVPGAAVLTARAGQRLRLGLAPAGLRCYIAVRGGIDVPPVLGSRSRDTLAGIGPEALRPGDVLPVGAAPRRFPRIDAAPVATITTGTVTARVLPGPRDDWFTAPEALFAGDWSVSTDADRIGVRLDRPDGQPLLVRAIDRELPTEGMPTGAIQVPPNGRPVVFLADHPITGGYPVIGTVIDADLPLLAQARPGQRVRFRRAR